LVGGGARSEYWAQLLANILDRPVYTLHGSELSACIGAARLGFMAIGQGVDGLQAEMAVKARYLPMRVTQAVLRARHEKFRGLLWAAQQLHELSS
jgi:xylulokinase